MILTHFSVQDWELERNWIYLQGHWKPRGLWLSDENTEGWGWKTWCEDESFGLSRLQSATDFTLTEDANIIHLKNIEEVLAFHDEWKDPDYYPNEPSLSRINWEPIAEKYDGILITPYERDWRMNFPMWYCGWDVPSGCFWNLNILQQVKQPMKAIES